MNALSVASLLALAAMQDEAAPSRSTLTLPAIFGDSMVLQRDAPVPVWGWAEAGETVRVSIAGQEKAAVAGDDGRFEARLDALPAGGPHTLSIAGRESITFEDVLVGEVWLGSGQSNMAIWLRECRNGKKEVANAKHPTIRLFNEQSGPASEPQSMGRGRWQVCSPETATFFSGTLYFFGRELSRELGVPIGLINSSMGSSPIESWITAEAQRECPELAESVELQTRRQERYDAEALAEAYKVELEEWREAVAAAKAKGRRKPKIPHDPVELVRRCGFMGELYNGKVAPIVPFGIRGVVWYQGEANGANAWDYEVQLPLLVRDWRARWSQGDFPFAWVQLPSYSYPGRPLGCNWPTVREAMRRALVLPNTGMAITIDIGDADDIHPKNKLQVGQRLAAWALGEVYGQDVASSGPLYASHTIEDGVVKVRFEHTDGGLQASDGGAVRGFEVADQDGTWHPAEARIDGDEVVVSSPAAPEPAHVRYAWENFPDCNLFNGAELPASPFTTGANNTWRKR